MQFKDGGIDQRYKERMEQKANFKAANSFGSTIMNLCASNQFKSINAKFKEVSSTLDPNSASISNSFSQKSSSQQQQHQHQQQLWFQSVSELLGINVDTIQSDQDNFDTIMELIKDLKNNLTEQQKVNSILNKENNELKENNKNLEGAIFSLRKWGTERDEEMERMLNTISQCDHDMAIHEQDAISKKNELEKQIYGLKTEIFKFKETEVCLKEEIENLKKLEPELENSKLKIEELNKDIKVLENKNLNLKKIARERELKCEKLGSQLSSTRSKYSNKLRSIGIETGKTIDSLLVELKLVKGINEKLLNNSIPSPEEVNDLQTKSFDELYNYFAKETPQHYVQKVYENRYLSSLLALKQTTDSNEIHHTTIESLLKLICSYFDKFPSLTHEHVVYFRTLVNEFHKRKMLKNADIDFIKKILNTYDQMMEIATDESMLDCVAS